MPLSLGYLSRCPPHLDGWIALLERHQDRPECVATWRAMALFDLRHLGGIEPARVARFVDRLFTRFSSVRDSDAGAILTARTLRFLPADVLSRILDGIRDGPWEGGPQAYGELLGILALKRSEDMVVRQRLDDALNPPLCADMKLNHIRLGLAFAGAEGWRDDATRAPAADLLLRLLPPADGDIAYAVMRLFAPLRPLQADDTTRRLLRGVLDHPPLLQAGNSAVMIHRLEGLLHSEPDLVHGLCAAFVRCRGVELATMLPGSPDTGEHLINIALTLQRLGEGYREKGLALFEELLDLGVHDAQRLLQELDHRPLNLPPLPNRRRRRAGSTSSEVR